MNVRLSLLALLLDASSQAQVEKRQLPVLATHRPSAVPAWSCPCGRAMKL